MNKICKLTNDKFSWILEVDGQSISFNGASNADYFALLYAELGYDIVWDRDKWREDQESSIKITGCPECGVLAGHLFMCSKKIELETYNDGN